MDGFLLKMVEDSNTILSQPKRKDIDNGFDLLNKNF